jgi:hypothetical protein
MRKPINEATPQMLRLVGCATNPRDRIYVVAGANTACRQSELKVVKRNSNHGSADQLVGKRAGLAHELVESGGV